MQEHSKYAVGLDIGTNNVRCVIAHIDATTGAPTIVGVGTAANSGMRKGVIVNLNGPAQAIDDALGEAERMSGYQVDSAAVSANGAHILSTHSDGMIAISGADHTVSQEDVMRIEEVATLGKVPANREILEVVPHSYKLDGQDNIKDPIGMTGTRLEVNAHVVSALSPHIANLQRACEVAKINPNSIVQAGIAAARAVLNESQLENGVALIDIGGSTTNVAIYEEGDLQYSAVIPLGGVNITNDLAIGLKTDPEIAEQVKIQHASAVNRHENSGVSVKSKSEIFNFKVDEIDEIVEARLEEIFEAIQHELKRAGRAGKLPGGVVLTGGTALLKGLDDYAREALGLAAKIGKTTGYGGVADDIEKPQFATAVGLMLMDMNTESGIGLGQKSSSKSKGPGLGAFLSGFFGRFKA